ncbi:MAG TPA: serpin family protein [Polyangiaceae bacterium]|nr:serpin family protein [Polyangiaceae bacterium]
MTRKSGIGMMIGGLALGVLLYGCSAGDTQPASIDHDGSEALPTTSNGGQSSVVAEVRSGELRVTPAPSEAAGAAKSEAAFAFKFLHALSADENVTFSPHSLSTAFAMLSDAAAGDTLQEIEDTFSFGATNEAFNRSQDALDLALAARNRDALDDGLIRADAQVLRGSNDLWLHRDAAPAGSFLDHLARYYGAGVHQADFGGRPEPCRDAINAKVSEDTHGLIAELLPSGAIDDSTVAVLTNALYFKAPWEVPFSAPHAGEFHLLDGGESLAQLLNATRPLDYYEGEGFVSVAVPYYGRELSLLLVVPDEGRYAEVREQLSGETLAAVVAGLRNETVDLTLPTFALASSLPVVKHLKSLGLSRAFDKTSAEFPKLQSPKFEQVHLHDVLHQATVAIDERGTEASAATAIRGTGGGSSGPAPEVKVVTADRPFLFVIRDNASRSLLFVGQVVKP